jgi:hypothetical protein
MDALRAARDVIILGDMSTYAARRASTFVLLCSLAHFGRRSFSLFFLIIIQ